MSGDLATGIGKAVGAAASGAATGGIGTIAAVFSDLFKLLASEGGQKAVLELLPHPDRIKAAQEKLDAAAASAPAVGPSDTR